MLKNIISSSQGEDGHLTNPDTEKAQVLNTFFASVLNMDDGPRGSQSLRWRVMTGRMIN